ncbi:hypothetical protein KPSA1_00085 [Pseudomonas syringae pv. actinidiae]|uniref:Uncharacterized protein n=1 Tax=Pseudomonas syringae pv. actinidiae TaxID=103796 RepID=A0A2V0Q3N7_PSESF|nr:hypothetical protein KPSA1_00085 [Pseudomonas syringae pv. actinidiae]
MYSRRLRRCLSMYLPKSSMSLNFWFRSSSPFIPEGKSRVAILTLSKSACR